MYVHSSRRFYGGITFPLSAVMGVCCTHSSAYIEHIFTSPLFLKVVKSFKGCQRTNVLIFTLDK